MKHFSSFFSLLLLGAAPTVGVGGQAATAKRPNIPLIFSDDHAQAAISSYGSKVNVHFTCVVLAALTNISFMSGAEPCARSGLLQVRKDAHVGQK